MFNILVSALIASSMSFAVTPQEIARNFKAKISSLESLEASFIHIYYSLTSTTPLEEKGKFTLKRPDLMRWEYMEPEKKIFVYREGMFLSYSAEDNQLIRQPVDQEAAETSILGILTARTELEEQYIIESSPFPMDDPPSWQIKLTPRTEGETSHFLLEIDRKTWLLRKAIVFDWAGDKQEFRFSKIKTNPRLGPDLFEIKPPPGCEIIDQAPPPVKKTARWQSGIPDKPFPPCCV